MNKQPPIYVINMAKDAARMASMAQQLAEQGLEFERVEAVVGAELTAEQRRASYSKFWYYLFMGGKPTAAELGCFLSHRKIWKMILDRGQSWAVIFEDDALLTSEFSKFLDGFESATTSDDVVHFYSLKQPDVVISSIPETPYRKMRYSGPNPTCTAYGLRASGAIKLLKFERMLMTSDKWIMARALLGVKCVAINPFPIEMHKTLGAISTIGKVGHGERQGHIAWRILVLPILRIARTICLKVRDV